MLSNLKSEVQFIFWHNESDSITEHRIKLNLPNLSIII